MIKLILIKLQLLVSKTSVKNVLSTFLFVIRNSANFIHSFHPGFSSFFSSPNLICTLLPLVVTLFAPESNSDLKKYVTATTTTVALNYPVKNILGFVYKQINHGVFKSLLSIHLLECSSVELGSNARVPQ